MKLITRNTDYAIRALCCIAGHQGQRVSADQLVKNLDMPRPFLRRILQALNKEGILYSFKGKGGGFVLAIPPKKINIMHLMQIFQGNIKINECTFKKNICPNVNECLLKKKIDNIEKEVIRSLEKITLYSLLNEKQTPSRKNISRRE